MTIILNKCQCSPGVKVDGGCKWCNPKYAIQRMEDQISEIEEELSGVEGDLANQEWEHDRAIDDADEKSSDLLVALRDLTENIDLSKLNIRKDFSLINTHAAALKAINKHE